jgi:hypothetical protein
MESLKEVTSTIATKKQRGKKSPNQEKFPRVEEADPRLEKFPKTRRKRGRK